jgi:3-Ketosteroid 9alpha-hydroxylase C-terminal domain
MIAPRLHDFAIGWYALAFSHELRAGDAVRRRLMHQELIVSRAPSGEASVMRGAWRWPVREQHGVILAYPGDAPAWEIRPIEAPYAHLAWSAPATRMWRIRTHPQEIIENTVDVAHFAPVHGYGQVEVIDEMQAHGPHLTMGYAVARNRGLVRMQLAITASGIGYSRVQVRALGLQLRTIVMPTPVEDDFTEVRVVTQIALEKVMRRRWLADRVARIAASEMGRDFAADIRIWEHKRYQDPPRLVTGDGPIGPYRKWVRQFYREQRA